MKNSLITRIRKSPVTKAVAAFMAIGLVHTIVYPTTAMALTSGPSQPEFQSFEPVEASNMVDLFSGDFTYNLPLFELPGPNGGYPFNMAYHSGITMDQEASWVGLGWNINPGVINRGVRGIPDDFTGYNPDGGNNKDYIHVKKRMLDNHVFGLRPGLGFELFGSDKLKAGVGMSVYYNNYRGMGYSLSPSFSLGLGENKNIGIGLSLSLDSQEGVGMTPSLSINSDLSSDKGIKNNKFGVGVGFHSEQGFNYSLSYSEERQDVVIGQDEQGYEISTLGGKNIGHIGSSYSMWGIKSGVPDVNLATKTVGINVSLKFGPEVTGFFKNTSFSGFWRGTFIRDEYKSKWYDPVGYNYLEHSGSTKTAEKNQLQDYTRYKGGALNINTSNLPFSQMTYDMYSVSGQGIGGVFRPHRNSYAHLHRNRTKSISNSFALGFDIGGGNAAKLGVNGSYTYGQSQSGEWKDNNGLAGQFTSERDKKTNYEDYYFKFQGEKTTYDPNELGDIAGEEPVRPIVALSGSKVKALGSVLEKSDETTQAITNFYKKYRKRERSSNIQHYINRNMIDYNGSLTVNEQHIPGEYLVDYYDMTAGTPNNINKWKETKKGNIIQTKLSDQATYKRNHIGGFSILKKDGSRYVYGIPVYNREKKEVTYSADNKNSVDSSKGRCAFNTTETKTSGSGANKVLAYEVSSSKKMLDYKATSPYATSYLITSILGADYVDTDGIPGPSNGDMGYWVKFNYIKTNKHYQWRGPFTNARYSPGFENDFTLVDDMASYQYGKKEVFYLSTVETSSHIAVFKLGKDRKDGFGASGEFNSGATGSIDPSSKNYQLDEISLYTKDEFQKANPIPIKRVHFEYTNTLCPNIYNSNTKGAGKLTLKTLSFSYGNNQRGKITPYTFDYNELKFNPGYEEHLIDRWGNYQTNYHLFGPSSNGYCELRNHPYTYQFNGRKLQTKEEKAAFKRRRDLESSAWHLKTIGLPSGGKMEINYEADDYAYVQHRKATQMFKIAGIGNAGQYNIKGNDLQKKKIIFQLEHPIPVPGNGSPATASATVRSNYLEALKREDKYQLFFKIRVNLRDNLYQPVAGWATFDLNNGGVVNTPSAIKTINGVQCYTQGYVVVDDANIPNTPSGQGYNPLEVAGMMHLRTSQPEMLTAGYAPATITPSSSNGKMTRIKGLASFFFSIKKMFMNFYNYCRSRNFCDEISLEDSYIRLATPDGKKFGGGTRVQSIEIFDNWGDMTGDGSESASYGQYYDYTISSHEHGGRRISSGVAANEPVIGGEENPLRYARFFGQEISPAFWGGNGLFFEFPINEAYYPAASVGYSKVKVMSKNTKDQLDDTNNNKNIVASTGVTINEFYTAKDYPVIAHETPINKAPYYLYFPIPFVGMIENSKIGYGQGYSVVLNDMHGKPKKVSTYAVSTDGEWAEYEVSSKEYVYKDTPTIVDGVTAKKLTNKITTLSQDFDWNNNNVPKKEMTVGEDYEFFMESNRNRSTSTMGGINFDGDGFLIGVLPLFITMFWPSYSRNVQEDSYAVTNKVIYKTGVLDHVVSKDENAEVVQKNEYFDELTGAPVVVSTTNKYHKTGAELKTYQYQTPGYWAYGGMGAAYKNYDFVFKGNVNSYDAGTKLFTLDASSIQDRHDNSLTWSNFEELMHEGDELIASSSTGKVHTTLVTLKTGTTTKFYAKNPLTSGVKYTFRVIRSGKRNQLEANVGSTISFSDPTTKSKIDMGNVNIMAGQLLANYLNDQLSQGVPANGVKNLALGDPDYPGLASLFTKIEIIGSTTKQVKFTYRNTLHGTGLYKIYESSKGSVNNYSGDDLFVQINYGSGPEKAQFFKPYHILLDTKYMKIDNVLLSSAVVLKDKWGVEGGTSNPNNPFATGERGIFRPVNDYVYDAYRLQSAILDLKKDGVYYDRDVTSNNTRFYAFNWQPTAAKPIHHYWKQNRTITKYNNKGFEVENKDALGVPSSAKYGYQGMLPVVSGQNINYSSLFYLGADDPSEPSTLYNSYFETTGATSHTGYQSFKKKSSPGEGIEMTIPFTAGKKYVFSSWVSNGYGKVAGVAQLMDYTAARNSSWTGKIGVELRFFNTSGTEVFNSGYSASNRETIYPSGEKIEQWQRVEGEFTMPATATKLKLYFNEPTQLSGKTYWDDLRIYPVGSLVKTFVYDPVSLRLLATLDENNYSVQYTYDESGNLYSTRVETPKGIRSISESRAYTKKQ